MKDHLEKEIKEVRVYECLLDNENHFSRVKPWMNYLAEMLIGHRLMHTAMFLESEDSIVFVNYTAEGLSLEMIPSD